MTADNPAYADDDAWELEARRKASALPRHTFTPPATTGPVHPLAARLEPGWEIYSTTRALGDPDHKIGGIVVDATTRRTADPDTGEVGDTTAYHVYDPFVADHLAWQWIDQADIDPDRITPPSRAACWTVIGRLCRQIGAGNHYWPTPKDLDRLAVAVRLARVVT